MASPSTAQSVFPRSWWTSAWIAPVVAVAAYLHTCWFSFVLDDDFITRQGSIAQRLANIPSFFVTDAFQRAIGGIHSRYFRPLYWTAFAFEWRAFGVHPWGAHLVNVLAHALVCWLVYRFALALRLDRGAAVLAGVLFALHPVHVEVVAYIASVGELLMLASLLAGLVLYIDYRRRGDTLSIALVGLFFLTGLWSKEMTIVLPLLILLYEVFFGRIAEAFRPRVIIWFGAALGVYLAFRSIAIPGLYTPDHEVSLRVALLTVPQVLAFYAGHVLAPLSQSTFYDQYYVVDAGRAFWTPLLIVGAVVAATVVGLRKLRWDPLLTFCASAAAVSLAPVLDVRAFTWRELAHDRYAYLPSVFVCIALAALLCRIRSLTVRRAASGGLVIAYAVLLVIATLAWRDPVSVFARGIETAPTNVRPRYGYAMEMLARGNRAEAARQFTEIVKWAPHWFEPRSGLAQIAFAEGRYADAEQYIASALAVRPDADGFVLLAGARIRMGNFAGAEQPLRDAIKLAPSTPGLHFNLGRCLAEQHRDDEAKAEFNAEIATNTRYAQAAREELSRLR